LKVGLKELQKAAMWGNSKVVLSANLLGYPSVDLSVAQTVRKLVGMMELSLVEALAGTMGYRMVGNLVEMKVNKLVLLKVVLMENSSVDG
jgi:hypothetical protein